MLVLKCRDRGVLLMMGSWLLLILPVRHNMVSRVSVVLMVLFEVFL